MNWSNLSVGLIRVFESMEESRMNMETFFGDIREDVANLVAKEVQDLDLMKVQMTAWVRFKVGVEDGDGDVVRVNTVDKVFNKWDKGSIPGSNLGKIIEKMFAHMRMQVENRAMVNSRFVFNRVLFLDVSFHQFNLTRGSSYLPLQDWISSKKAIITPQNEEDKECFKQAILTALHHKAIANNPQ